MVDKTIYHFVAEWEGGKGMQESKDGVSSEFIFPPEYLVDYGNRTGGREDRG